MQCSFIQFIHVPFQFLGLSEPQMPIIFNIWALMDGSAKTVSEPQTMKGNNNSTINWANVGQMLQGQNAEFNMSPSAMTLFENVKKHIQMVSQKS